ncbi:hypothetical protein CFE70_009931 [Pyrenophora teres f. teres 0-1]|uniref:Thioesterase domain-containing protein n=2 Tax=Pyrenophora teres f. teres TaxID=97479 RepID=E3RZH6_PYRTT|nr:hypothetical protein PTT_15054 [Pyrenophora teres f. teres 0-1]KAE8826861.1 hypothetical protein HRS9139_08033 [Pyrenophora teres f. teres]KAE8832378.1 hypothetical protein PTNB85_06770 [Pyrenophora teres f. teres]KAE8837013.1 hypothetical protein HRS9122_07168 [Pyrenophora teres f. teres]KAE8856040.1 hypothetical protein PTNB29_08879 [Pyrenophora teres f. teres]
MEAAIAHFSAVPWAAELIKDTANWTPIPTRAVAKKASGEDAFFSETISTDRTIRAILTLRSKEGVGEEIAYREIKELVDVGDRLDGYPHVMHGGITATLLDEVCGALINCNAMKKVERAGEVGRSIDRPKWMTAYLNTTYKAPVPTPGVLLCTATIVRQEGGDRKVYMRATVQDGNGTVCTVCEALFIKIKSQRL